MKSYDLYDLLYYMIYISYDLYFSLFRVMAAA